MALGKHSHNQTGGHTHRDIWRKKSRPNTTRKITYVNSMAIYCLLSRHRKIKAYHSTLIFFCLFPSQLSSLFPLISPSLILFFFNFLLLSVLISEHHSSPFYIFSPSLHLSPFFSCPQCPLTSNSHSPSLFSHSIYPLLIHFVSPFSSINLFHLPSFIFSAQPHCLLGTLQHLFYQSC